MRTGPNNFVQAIPVCAILFVLRRVPGVPDDNRCGMNVLQAICLLGIGFLSTGCRSPQEDLQMHLPLGHAFYAHIQRTSLPNTNSLIRLFVGGAVHHPDRVDLASGSTVLDAIKLAGGFTDFASTRRLVVERRGSRIGLVLRREVVGVGFRNHYRVWYAPPRPKPSTHGNEPMDRAAKTDFILESDDRIWVPQTL